ncbi:unnamed protein product [Caenorhabditis angaria]|uniref:C-type lectin domain-containing protein n=1 Tax=Caenorhabditis angaria TaxID=860376 RepID=A0A9P1I8L4_9PELO|nr:unnamed protein product [Caenorhabditis angaria]
MRFSPLLILIFSLATLDSIDATSCMDGFVLLNGAKCVKVVTDQVTRDVARRECNLLGGHLITPDNQIDNNAIYKMVISNQAPIWIGAKCQNGQQYYEYSCVWDDYTSHNYNYFYTNYPNFTVGGQCLYMSHQISNQGNWYNTDCDKTTASYICETEPIGNCKIANNPYCYWAIGELTKDEAVNACGKYCSGQIISIHNDYENQIVYNNYFYSSGLVPYFRIGAQLSSHNLNYWIDNSTWDYSNIGFQSLSVGSCYSISLQNQEVARGKWLSADCSYQLPTICKRPLIDTCSPTPDTPTQCTTPTYLSTTNASVVESPNYPYPYCTNPIQPCFYVLTGPQGTSMNIRFPVFNLDTNSTIQLFSSFDESAPFKTLSQSNYNGAATWYISPSNFIKLVFNDLTTDCNSTTAIYRWQAQFQPSTTILN